MNNDEAREVAVQIHGLRTRIRQLEDQLLAHNIKPAPLPQKIARDSIAYTGYSAACDRLGRALSYTVSGRGKFPEDMLRYDGATVPAGVPDGYLREVTEVKISDARQVTPERWRSFGWSVHDDIVLA